MLSHMTLRRWWQSAAVCLLAIVMLGAADASSRFGRLGHEMICVCGCGQILLECNHVGCPDSDRMIGELRQQVASGGADTRRPQLVLRQVRPHRPRRSHPRRLR